MAGTILKQLSSTAQTNGTTITAANSGLTSISIGAENSATFQSAAAMGESAGYRFSQGAAGNQLTSYIDLDSAVNVIALRVPFRISATPTAHLTFLRGYTNTAHTEISWSIQLTTTMRLSFMEQLGGTTTTSSSASARLQANTDYVIQVLINTSTQTFSLATYERGSQTPINSIGGPMNNPMGAQRAVRLGINTNSSIVGGYFETNSAFAIGSGDLLARHDISNLSPTVALTSDTTTLNTGETAYLTATASDPDGTITNYAWSTTYGTLVGSGNTRTITVPPLSSNLSVTITVTVTDSGGATATDSIVLTFTSGEASNLLWQLSSVAQTNGTTVTAANSNFSTVSIGSGNTVTFQSDAAMGQPAGYRFSQGAAGNQITTYVDFAEEVDIISFRLPIKISAAPSASLTFLRAFSDTGHSNVLWSFQITTTMRINFGHTGGTTVTTGSGTSERLIAGNEYVMQILIDTINQTYSLTTYPRNSQTPIHTLAGAFEAETSPVRSFRFGINTASALVSGYIDTNSAFAVGTGTLLPRHDVSNLDPTLSVTTSKTVLHPGEFATITASASDSDGTVANVAWSTNFGTLVGSGNTRTITVPPLLNDQTVTINVVATDDDGGTANRYVVLTFKGSMHKVYTGSGWAPAVVKLED